MCRVLLAWVLPKLFLNNVWSLHKARAGPGTVPGGVPGTVPGGVPGAVPGTVPTARPGGKRTHTGRCPLEFILDNYVKLSYSCVWLSCKYLWHSCE